MATTPARKRIIAAALAAGIVLLAGCAEHMFSRPAYYSGPRTDHYDGTHFFNPEGESGSGGAQKDGIVRFLEIGAGDDHPVRWPHVAVHQTVPARRIGGGAMRVTWIGHASTLVQT